MRAPSSLQALNTIISYFQKSLEHSSEENTFLLKKEPELLYHGVSSLSSPHHPHHSSVSVGGPHHSAASVYFSTAAAAVVSQHASQHPHHSHAHPHHALSAHFQQFADFGPPPPHGMGGQHVSAVSGLMPSQQLLELEAAEAAAKAAGGGKRLHSSSHSM